MKIAKLTVLLFAMVILLAAMPAAMAHNFIDVKPGSCPNSINLDQKGVLPIAILGGEEVDVMDIDPATIMVGFMDANGTLVYVPIVRYSYEDVAGPVIDPDDEYPCCGTPGPDGVMDLSIKVNVEDLVAAGLSVDDYPKLEVRYDKYDGTTVRSLWDCIRMIDNSDKGVGPDAVPAQANKKVK